LALGRHADLVGELESLVSWNPLRERLRAQLMVALYRSGREADALSIYHLYRDALASELGLEPSSRMRELERRILRQDPGLDGRAGGPMGTLFAATHPDRTQALVTLGAYARRNWAPDYPIGRRPEQDGWLRPTAEQWGRFATERFLAERAPTIASDEEAINWY